MKKRPSIPETIYKYINNQIVRCPRCKVEFQLKCSKEDIWLDGESASLTNACPRCSFKWVECYFINRILEEGETK